MAINLESLKARFEMAKTERLQFHGMFEDAYHYAMPNRNLFENEAPGADKNSDVFDTTLGHATNIFVSKLINGLTPPFQRWAKLVAGEDVPIQLKNKINSQLEDATDLLFKFIHRSNFGLAIGESYFDLAVGTMSLLLNPGPNDKTPLIFKAVDTRFLAPEAGPLGTIETAWRELKQVTARNVLEIWPQAKLTAEVAQLIRDNPNSKLNFIEGSVEQADGKFLYIVWQDGENEAIVEEVTESSPWIIARWKKLSNETFGRGPILDALPTALTLNMVMDFELRAAALGVGPMYMAYGDSVFNPSTLRVQPNTIIPVQRLGTPTWPIQKLDTKGDFNFTQVLVKDLRQQINAFLFTDVLGPNDTPVRTATEVNIRNQQLLEEIGPAIGRLEVELLGKIINRSIFLLKKRGLFPNIEIDGRKIALSFESPLARSQDAQDLNALVQFNEVVQAIMQNPQTLAAYNAVQLPEFIAEKTGLNLSLVKNPQEMQQAAQVIQQQQQQQQLQQEAAQQAQQQGVQRSFQPPRALPSPQGTTGLAA